MSDFESVVDDWDDDVDEEQDYQLDIGFRAFVSGSDWTVGTLLDQIRQGNIDVAPDFQRRSVWDERRGSRFIESVFLGLPIPQLVFAESQVRPGSFIVLDGKQRLLTLEAFASGSPTWSGNRGLKPLTLKHLEILEGLDGKNLNDLELDPRFADLVRQFQNRTIRTVVISGWKTDDYLNLVFRRLNSGSVPLSSQELRQALHPGPFSHVLNEFTVSSVPLQRALGLRGPDFRMRDVELALRFVSLDLRLSEYSGNLKHFLDTTVVRFNENWAQWETEVGVSLLNLNDGIATAELVFGRHAFRRYTEDGYESRFNRAVFDVQSLAFARSTISDAARSNPERVKLAFESRMIEDQDFADSFVSTTKSISATYDRLHGWIEALNRTLDQSFPTPHLQANRITWAR